MKHFIYHTRSGVDNKVLLILDNHKSHVSYECLERARHSGVTMLTLPSHCSHKLQPLDRSVFGPFKRYYNAACDDWVVENPRPMHITDIASLVSRSYALAFTPSNITAGFAATGIEPLNTDVLYDDKFLASSVTDRSQPAAGAPVTVVAAVPVSQSSDNASSTDTAFADQSLVVAIVTSSCSTVTSSQSISDVTATCVSSTVVSQSPTDVVTSTPSAVASCQSSPVTLKKLRPVPKAGAGKSKKNLEYSQIHQSEQRLMLFRKPKKRKSLVCSANESSVCHRKSQKKTKTKQSSEQDNRDDYYVSCCYQFCR